MNSNIQFTQFKMPFTNNIQINTNEGLIKEFNTPPNEVVDFVQLNKKLDDILSQLNLLRNEIQDFRQNNRNYVCSTNHSSYPSFFRVPNYNGPPITQYPPPNIHIGK